jgi:hypothetical protein
LQLSNILMLQKPGDNSIFFRPSALQETNG